MPAVRKTPWSNKARKGVIEGKPLNPSAAIEQRYYTALRVLINRMVAETELELKKLFKTEHAEEYFAQDASVSSQARILTNALIKKYTDLFASLSKPMAERFADESNQSSDIAVKSSIRHLSDQLMLSTKTITSGPLNDILSATITENVALIKSIPAQYLSGVQQAVMRSITWQRHAGPGDVPAEAQGNYAEKGEVYCPRPDEEGDDEPELRAHETHRRYGRHLASYQRLPASSPHARRDGRQAIQVSRRALRFRREAKRQAGRTARVRVSCAAGFKFWREVMPKFMKRTKDGDHEAVKFLGVVVYQRCGEISLVRLFG